MGAGAGAVVLEPLDLAQRRGARIYAEVVGVGTSADAHHVTAPHPDGLGARLAIAAPRLIGVAARRLGATAIPSAAVDRQAAKR